MRSIFKQFIFLLLVCFLIHNQSVAKDSLIYKRSNNAYSIDTLDGYSVFETTNSFLDQFKYIYEQDYIYDSTLGIDLKIHDTDFFFLGKKTVLRGLIGAERHCASNATGHWSKTWRKSTKIKKT